MIFGSARECTFSFVIGSLEGLWSSTLCQMYLHFPSQGRSCGALYIRRKRRLASAQPNLDAVPIVPTFHKPNSLPLGRYEHSSPHTKELSMNNPYPRSEREYFRPSESLLHLSGTLNIGLIGNIKVA